MIKIRNKMTKKIIEAPFTDEQVEAINLYQKNGVFHPYTCGGNRTDGKHLDGEGILVATKEGLKCPYCDYTQNWVNGDTANKGLIKKIIKEMKKQGFKLGD